MKKPKLLITVITVTIGVFLLLFGIHQAVKPKKGALFESYIFEGSRLKIKVESRHENGLLVWLPGAYYDYEAKRNDSDSWQPIFTFYFDNPMKIPKEQIKEINEKVSYVFIGWMYSVTTDGGKTWSTWDADKKQQCGFIQSVELGPEGQGTMNLYDRTGATCQLYTTDFGKTWR